MSMILQRSPDLKGAGEILSVGLSDGSIRNSNVKFQYLILQRSPDLRGAGEIFSVGLSNGSKKIEMMEYRKVYVFHVDDVTDITGLKRAGEILSVGLYQIVFKRLEEIGLAYGYFYEESKSILVV